MPVKLLPPHCFFNVAVWFVATSRTAKSYYRHTPLGGGGGGGWCSERRKQKKNHTTGNSFSSFWQNCN